MQGNLQIEFLMKEYEEEVQNLQKQLIMVKAYARQLESELETLKPSLENSEPKQEVVPNESK